jgi:inner membrane protein YhjD
MTDPIAPVIDGLRTLDRIQQRHPRLAFIVAVFKKFTDDNAGQLAAVISYYAFFALFPLLLVFVTVLGFVLQGDATLQHRIVNSGLAQFPVIGQKIVAGRLHGSGAVLGVGLAGSLFAGLGLTQAIRTALDTVWGVERHRRDDFITARLRGLALLGILGVAVIASTVLTGLVGAGAPSGAIATAGLIVLSAGITFGLFLAAFWLLTSYRAEVRELIPGAVVATIGWQILQYAGTWLVNRELRHADEVAGYFGTVLGLLFWLSIGAQLTLFAAEINVVRAKRLWPRRVIE